jgi:D-proline reductase (dithiol) PrdB
MVDADAPIKYMERTRHYYRALGYTRDYVWAAFDEVPFTQIPKPLSQLRIALITTASPRDFDGVKRVWSGKVSPPPSLYTDNVAWDKESTHTKDRESFLPIEAASKLAAEGVFAGLTARFHGVPTEYSQRKTREEDAPKILTHVREDGADAAVLCPLCPVCHQTLSMVARHLEANGIPTVIIGSALDVVEYCGVPRFYFNDFPLGNPCGHPWKPEMQRDIVRQALHLLETARGPRTTVKSPFTWHEDGAVWRARYGRVNPAEKERLFALGEERRRQQVARKKVNRPASAGQATNLAQPPEGSPGRTTGHTR